MIPRLIQHKAHILALKKESHISTLPTFIKKMLNCLYGY